MVCMSEHTVYISIRTIPAVLCHYGAVVVVVAPTKEEGKYVVNPARGRPLRTPSRRRGGGVGGDGGGIEVRLSAKYIFR